MFGCNLETGFVEAMSNICHIMHNVAIALFVYTHYCCVKLSEREREREKERERERRERERERERRERGRKRERERERDKERINSIVPLKSPFTL